MFAGLTGWHFLIIALIILLIFGATRLPALAKGLGQSMKIFRDEVRINDDPKPPVSSTPAPPTSDSSS